MFSGQHRIRFKFAQQPPESPPTIQKIAIKTTTSRHQNHHQPPSKIQKNSHQLPKKQAPTTKSSPTIQKTTTNSPKIHIKKAKTPTKLNQKHEKKTYKQKF